MKDPGTCLTDSSDKNVLLVVEITPHDSIQDDAGHRDWMGIVKGKEKTVPVAVWCKDLGLAVCDSYHHLLQMDLNPRAINQDANFLQHVTRLMLGPATAEVGVKSSRYQGGYNVACGGFWRCS